MTRFSAERITRWSGATSVLLGAAIVFACGTAAGAQSPPLTDAERTAIADTIARLSRDNPTGPQPAVDCGEISRLGRAAVPKGLGGHNAADWNLVSEGRIFPMSSNEERADACRLYLSVRQERRSSSNEILDQKIHVLSRDAAYLVNRLRETIQWTDGRTTVGPMAITQIWARTPSGWQRVHTHESWPPGSRDSGRVK
jgi:hypothetical protein